MNKKNGFVFIETVIVIVIVTYALISIFSTYNHTITDEKRRLTYNDVTYLYRTYHVMTWIISDENYDIPMEDTNYLDSSINALKDSLHIRNIYIVFGEDGGNYSSKKMNSFSKNLKNYLKTIEFKKNKRYLVVEYSEKMEGNQLVYCPDCKVKYAYLEFLEDRPTR